MPIFISYDRGDLAADLAAGAGIFEQGQAEHAMGLQSRASDRADRAQGLQGYEMILGDQRQRRQQDLSYDRSIDSAYTRGLLNQDLERLRQTGRLDVADVNNQSREGIAQGNREAAGERQNASIQGANARTVYSNQQSMERLREQQTGAGDRQKKMLAAQQARAVERQKHEMAVAAEKVKATAAQAQGRREVAEQIRQRAGVMEQLVREQRVLGDKIEQFEELGSPPPPMELARFQEITAQLRTMTGMDPMTGMPPGQQPMQQQPAPATQPTTQPTTQARPIAPQGFEPSPFLPPHLQPGASAIDPGGEMRAGAPQQITDATGAVWVFSGQFDPASGEPLYQRAQ